MGYSSTDTADDCIDTTIAVPAQIDDSYLKDWILQRLKPCIAFYCYMAYARCASNEFMQVHMVFV